MLMPLQSGKHYRTGRPLPPRFYQEYMLECFLAHGGIKADGSVSDEMWEQTIEKFNVPATVETNWNLHYDQDMWKNMFMERDQDQMEAGRCSLVEGWGVPPIAAAGDGAAVAVGPPAPGTRVWTSYILFSTRPATYIHSPPVPGNGTEGEDGYVAPTAAVNEPMPYV
eukprot:scaffold11647_cov99-Amphora_coffeaeformis.AAC.1